MKRYFPLLGAVGVAAALGAYWYTNRDPLYEQSEEFLKKQEKRLEHEAELPEKKAPVSYDSPKVKREEKNIPKSSPNSNNYDQNYNQKQKNCPKELQKNYLPDSQKLDDVAEEGEDVEDEVENSEERPSYDLSTKKRKQLSDQQLSKYGQEALRNKDYKIAETYSSDLKKRHEEGYGNEKSPFDECNISEAYERDLSEMIENCKNYDHDSVFRKVMWMNIFFIPNYERSIPDCKINIYDNNSFYIKNIDPSLLIQKGNQALKAIEYCNE